MSPPTSTAAILDASDAMAEANQLLLLSLAVQLTPESRETYSFPPESQANKMVPSAEEDPPHQLRLLSLAVQFAPESVDV